MIFTLYVLYVELVYLLGELILFNGLSAGNRKRKAPFKVLHLVHGAERQPLWREREREREGLKLTRQTKYGVTSV